MNFIAVVPVVFMEAGVPNGTTEQYWEREVTRDGEQKRASEATGFNPGILSLDNARLQLEGTVARIDLPAKKPPCFRVASRRHRNADTT